MTAPPPALARETSLYLDAVRFLAALVVFLGHFSTQSISGGLFWQLAPFRHDAVIVFFVLSGFVIAHAVATKERGAADYVINRAARIYSVAVPAIAITLMLDAIGARLDPAYFGWSYSTGALWQQIAASLTFTNQLWNWGLFPGSDGPYWSLGFEVPYYAMFGSALFARGPWRIILPVALAAIAGPTVVALFPLWLVGVAVYRSGKLRLPEWLGWALFLGSILGWAAIEAWALGTKGWILDYAIPGLWRDRIPADYVTGIAFALNLFAFPSIAHRFGAALRFAARPIRFLAGLTFSLYLLHYPVMKFLATVLPWGPGAMVTRATILVVTALVVLVAAALFERRKSAWRRFFAAAFEAGEGFLNHPRPARVYEK
jgi:peptidoglycan/LPS O-acetylase OafA/YrhL